MPARPFLMAGLTLLLAACAASPPPPALLAIDAAAVGFREISMTAREVLRGDRASVIEFRDLRPDRGSALAKGLFQLRCAATLAVRRGFSHFIILEKNRGETQYLVGLLDSAQADPGTVFGADYAHLGAAGIIATAATPPLDMP